MYGASGPFGKRDAERAGDGRGKRPQDRLADAATEPLFGRTRHSIGSLEIGRMAVHAPEFPDRFYRQEHKTGHHGQGHDKDEGRMMHAYLQDGTLLK